MPHTELLLIAASRLQNTESSISMLCLSQFVPIYPVYAQILWSHLLVFPNSMVDAFRTQNIYFRHNQHQFFRICYLTSPLRVLTLLWLNSNNIPNITINTKNIFYISWFGLFSFLPMTLSLVFPAIITCSPITDPSKHYVPVDSPERSTWLAVPKWNVEPYYQHCLPCWYRNRRWPVTPPVHVMHLLLSAWFQSPKPVPSSTLIIDLLTPRIRKKFR